MGTVKLRHDDRRWQRRQQDAAKHRAVSADDFTAKAVAAAQKFKAAQDDFARNVMVTISNSSYSRVAYAADDAPMARYADLVVEAVRQGGLRGIDVQHSGDGFTTMRVELVFPQGLENELVVAGGDASAHVAPEPAPDPRLLQELEEQRARLDGIEELLRLVAAAVDAA